MKAKSISAILLSATLLLPTVGCNSLKNTWNSMSQTGQGATAGGTIGAAVGTGVGALIGGGRGTWIGALVGGALGAGTGALVGNHMDQQKKELEKQLSEIRELKSKTDTTYIVQTVKDSNNLDAIRLMMGNSILFKTGKSTLSPAAQAALTSVAYNLKQFPESDVTVQGYTDNTGSEELNQRLSQERAESVVNYLISKGISPSRLKAVGMGWNNPIASNATPEGRAQNRRVELYIYASQQMIDNAERESGEARPSAQP